MLIQCPECNQTVSDTAEVCPHCGMSIKKFFLQQKLKEIEPKIKQQEEIVNKLQGKYNQIKEEITKNKLNNLVDVLPPVEISLEYMLFYGVSIIFNILSWYSIYVAYKNERAWGLAICLVLIASVLLFVTIRSIIDKTDEISKYKRDPHDYNSQRLQKNPDEYIRSYISTKEVYDECNDKLPEYIKECSKLHNLQDESRKLVLELEKLNKGNASVTVQPTVQPQTLLKCPVCGSYNVKRISTTSRMVSVSTVGLASSKIGKQYECKKCKHKW